MPDVARVERGRAILDAAARLFSERGYQGTTMGDIAAAVSLNKGTLYHYVPSKADLLARICGESVDDILLLFADLPADLEPAARVRRIVVGLVHELARRPHHAIVYLQEMQWVDEWLPAHEWASLRQRESLLHQHVASAIDAGVRDGSFSTTDPRVAALALIGMVGWTYRWFRDDGRRSIDEIAAVYAGLLLDGLLQGPVPTES